MKSVNVNADVLTYVRTIIGIILGLSVAHLLSGIARFIQYPKKYRIYPIHFAWVLSVFLLVGNYWWWEVRISYVSQWTFLRYFFEIVYASLFYLLCALLLPEDLEEYSGFKAYFFSRRKWIFGLLAIIYLADLYDTWLKGPAYFASLGIEYPIHIAIYTVLYIVAMITEDERFHGAFVIAHILYQSFWILRDYYTLN